MANLQGRAQLFDGDTTNVDTTARQAVFTRAYGPTGYEYIYLLGVASTAAQDLANWNQSTGLTIRLVANAVGQVGVAQAATVASTYGWYGIWGHYSVASDTTSGIGAVYTDGTAGRWDGDTDVSTEVIIGAFATAAAVANVCPGFVTYPHVANVVIN